ncbi:GNAT family N-acetyltransferase [Paenibacillus sp.]|uniref:GNAT family N-acetyltransferase n=1 Tax=Paenibacillus sp. TaxID=58172 RepID=UPI002D54B22D|nr:GNAT family N-acetyltransferase [Paenibacillus sp.]HZG58400.1 GNAT family N-acetyltransferase [Paenibacillus sp.]
MSIRKPLLETRRIEAVETALTRLNAARALSPASGRRLEVSELAGCTLLRDAEEPTSPYYNRVKGFGPEAVERLDDIFAAYGGSAPCFDMAPDRATPEVAEALIRNGYAPMEQLAFLAARPERDAGPPPAWRFERVTAETAETFVRWIGLSMGGRTFERAAVERARPYFHREDFLNYMLEIDGEPAAMGSLFLSGTAGYAANDYTFERYRGRGLQGALIRQRLAEAAALGLEAVYTDVEFGSASHGNMLKAGFGTVFLNTFWLKR